ncbi:MAG: patatin-like phospholipase family protein [Acidobacteriota bacterium]
MVAVPRLGLALGGGGARGLAHLGVLSVLDEAGLRPEVIVGTSFGALAGAAALTHSGGVEKVIATASVYLNGEEFKETQLAHFREYQEELSGSLFADFRKYLRRGYYYNLARIRASFIPPDEFERSVAAFVPDRTIESLPCRFGAVAADFADGTELLFDRGSLRLAVQASCAIPGVMAPVAVAERTCIDGGWVNVVPVSAVESLGADFVIAVDVSPGLGPELDLGSGLNVVSRGDSILSQRLKDLQLGRADVVVRCGLAGIEWAEFARADEIIDHGRRAAEEALPAILDRWEGAQSWPHRWRRGLEARLVRRGWVRSARPLPVRVSATEPIRPPVDGTTEEPA